MLTFFAKPTGFKRELGSTLIAISWETRLKSSARATLFCSIIYVVLPNYPPREHFGGFNQIFVFRHEFKSGHLPITQRGTPLPRTGRSSVPLLRFFRRNTP